MPSQSYLTSAKYPTRSIYALTMSPWLNTLNLRLNSMAEKYQGTHGLMWTILGELASTRYCSLSIVHWGKFLFLHPVLCCRVQVLMKERVYDLQASGIRRFSLEKIVLPTILNPPTKLSRAVLKTKCT